jgi:hypothetical protein
LYLTWGPRSAQSKERKHSQKHNNQPDDVDNSVHGRLKPVNAPAMQKLVVVEKSSFASARPAASSRH